MGAVLKRMVAMIFKPVSVEDILGYIFCALCGQRRWPILT